MAYTLLELGVDCVPINVLVPIKGTPMEGIERISAEDCVRTISIFRIILKDKTIKIAAGRKFVFSGVEKIPVCFEVLNSGHY